MSSRNGRTGAEPVPRRIKRVTLTVSRPNGYTTWSPRRDIGIDWTEYRFGCLRLVVER